MSKKIKKVSKKQIISITKFLSDYIRGPVYQGDKKLTHEVLAFHLRENYIPIPRRLSFQSVKEEDLLMGNVVYVRDKKGYKIPYENPIRVRERFLSYYLDSKSKVFLALIRKQLLNEIFLQEGLTEDAFGNIVSLEEMYYEQLEEKYNVSKKQKKVVYGKRKYYQRRGNL